MHTVRPLFDELPSTHSFVGIFKVLNGLRATIRLLDPPLHEFLPIAPLAAGQAALSDGKLERDTAICYRTTQTLNVNSKH